jgi:hypothetical protein
MIKKNETRVVFETNYLRCHKFIHGCKQQGSVSSKTRQGGKEGNNDSEKEEIGNNASAGIQTEDWLNHKARP